MWGWLRSKANSISEVTLQQMSEMAGFARYGSLSGMAATPRNAVEVAAVLCAGRVIAEGMAQMPIRIISEDVQGAVVKQMVLRDHWAHKLLAKKPNEFQTGFEFREYAVMAAVLDKGFLGIKNTISGEVREILPLPMGTWSLERVTGSWDYHFRVSYANGSSGIFSRDQVVHFRGPSLDGLNGLPALSAAREAIGLAKSLEKQQSNLAANGGKPSGVLSFEDTLSEESRNQLRETWQERFGPDGAGGVAILDNKATFQSMVMNSVDAQHLETRKFQIEEIARAFRVNPIMLMSSDKASTFASAEQFFRNHVIHTLGPWMRRFEEVCDRDILGHTPGIRTDLDERALLRGDFVDQADYYTKALGAGGQPGWMTVNEIRAERDMNPIDESWANSVPRGLMQPKDKSDDDQE